MNCRCIGKDRGAAQGPNSVPETHNVKLRGMDSNLPRSGREFGILWENHKFLKQRMD